MILFCMIKYLTVPCNHFPNLFSGDLYSGPFILNRQLPQFRNYS